MEFGYKFRIYPTPFQENLIQRTFGCCRFVFNYFLAERMDQYKQTGHTPTCFQQDKSLTALKKELPWLKEVDSISLQAALYDLGLAYQNFFQRVKQGQKPGYPKFKSKRDGRKSYKTKQHIPHGKPTIFVDSSHIRLPKLGLVKCRMRCCPRQGCERRKEHLE